MPIARTPLSMLSLQSLVLFERGEIVAEPPQTLCSLPQSCRHAASPSSGTNPGYNRRRTLRSYLETRAGYLHFSKTHWTEAHKKGEEVRSVPEWQTLCHHGRDTLRLSTPRYETCMVNYFCRYRLNHKYGGQTQTRSSHPLGSASRSWQVDVDRVQVRYETCRLALFL